MTGKRCFCPIPTDEAETWGNCPDKYGTKVAGRRSIAERLRSSPTKAKAP